MTPGPTRVLRCPRCCTLAPPGSHVAKQYDILRSAGLGDTTFNALATSNLPAGFASSLSYTSTDVLLNLTEARRWDVSYGFGFEVQTGAPTQGCLSPAEQMLLGISNSYKCNPNGHTGASPRMIG